MTEITQAAPSDPVAEIKARFQQVHYRLSFIRTLSPSKVTPDLIAAIHAEQWRSRVYRLRLTVVNPHEEAYLDDWEMERESLFLYPPALRDVVPPRPDPVAAFLSFEATAIDPPREVEKRLERYFRCPVRAEVLSERFPRSGELGLTGWRHETVPNRWGPWITWAPRPSLRLPEDVRLGDHVQADMVIRPRAAVTSGKPGLLRAQDFVVKSFNPWLMVPPDPGPGDTHMVLRYRVWEAPGDQDEQDGLNWLLNAPDSFSPYGGFS